MLLAVTISVAAALAGPIHGYFTYVVPMENYHDLEYFLGDIHYSPVNSSYDNYAAMGSVTLLENGSVDVVFTPDPKMTMFEGVPHFEHVENIKIGQTFAVTCNVHVNDEDPNMKFKPTTIQLIKYMGLATVDGAPMHSLYHVGVLLSTHMPCDYPEVIPRSVDVIDLHEERYFDEVLSSHARKLERLYDFEIQEEFEQTVSDTIQNVLGLEMGAVFADRFMDGPPDDAEPSGDLCGTAYHIPYHLEMLRDADRYKAFMEKYSEYPMEFALYDDDPVSGFKYQFTAHSGDGRHASTYFHIDPCHSGWNDFEDYILTCGENDADMVHVRGNESVVMSLGMDDFCAVP